MEKSSTGIEKIKLTGAYPDNDLALYISGYWEIKAEGIEPGKHLIVPDGRIGAIVELSSSSRWLLDDGYYDGNIVIGQQTLPVYLELNTTDYRAFGITFNPWGAAPFLGKSLDRFKNRAFPLQELFDQSQELQLSKESCFENRVIKAATFLRAILRSQNIDERLVRSIKRMIQDFTAPLSEIASDSNIGLRNLEMIARKQFGVSLSRFKKIVRLHNAAKAIIEKPEMSLTEIAGEMGYFDQAHMNRDFSELAGLSPAAIKKSDCLSLTMSGLHYPPEKVEFSILSKAGKRRIDA